MSSSTNDNTEVAIDKVAENNEKGDNKVDKGSKRPSEVTQIWTRKNLQEMVKSIDSNEQLDDDVEDFLLSYAEEYMESLMTGASVLATHRNSLAVDVKDIQTHLERNHNIWIPGFGTDELRQYKRSPLAEAHKQRTAIIKKTLKKY